MHIALTPLVRPSAIAGTVASDRWAVACVSAFPVAAARRLTPVATRPAASRGVAFRGAAVSMAASNPPLAHSAGAAPVGPWPLQSHPLGCSSPPDARNLPAALHFPGAAGIFLGRGA